MKQSVLITVLPAKESKALVEAISQHLDRRTVEVFIRSLVDRDRVVFHSEHLDLWSMGDSFELLLRPKKYLRCFSADSTILYTIPRDRLRLSAPARDDEERLLRDLLRHAKSLYRKAAPDAAIFVMRSVFEVSGDCNFPND